MAEAEVEVEAATSQDTNTTMIVVDNRIALISDIHGNALALRTVLDDIRNVRHISSIYCLGDVATLGPHPMECLKMIHDEVVCSSGGRWIRGNHDRYLLEEPSTMIPDAHNSIPPVQHAIEWCRSQLTDEAITILQESHVAPLTIQLGGNNNTHNTKVVLYHGSPRSDIEDWTESTPIETIQQVLAEYYDDNNDDDDDDDATTKTKTVLFCGGHTHVFMKRQVNDTQWVITVGSVGLPFQKKSSSSLPPEATEDSRSKPAPPKILPSADYTIVSSSCCDDESVNVEHIRLPLDSKSLIEAAEGWEHSELGIQLADMYREAVS